MRIVGTRKTANLGLRRPTAGEVQANLELASQTPRVVPKGVYRYRSQAEANADMERWIADGMARKAAALAGRKA